MTTKAEKIVELLGIISNKSERIKKLKLEGGRQSTKICVLNERIKELEVEIAVRPAKPLMGEARSRLLVAMDNSVSVDYAIEKYKKLQERIEKLEVALQKIDNWARAYPLKVFPEPDFKKVNKVLKTAGLSLDEVSASNMRHVINRIKNIVEQALKG